MPTSLLSPSASRRGIRRLLGSGALGLLLLGAAPQAQAQTVYGLSGTGPTPVLLSFNASAPGTPTTTPITGVASGQTLVGLDSRPATGELFALGYDGAGNGRLYTIAPSTGVATAVGMGTAPLALGSSAERISFDFNPTVDRIRVVSSNDKNYRLNPNTGGVAATDLDINLPAMANPVVGAVAYTNSFIGAASTTLYDIEESTSTLYIQNPPNDGNLTTPVSITNASMALLLSTDQVDFDIYTDPSTRAQTVLMGVLRGANTVFYTLNLSTGNASLVTTFPGVPVTDIAFGINRTAPAMMGQLAYGVTTASNLISFDTGNPSFIRTLVAITGLAAGQTLVGTDFRPSTGTLIGLGYNPTTGVANDRLYTINTTTGVATAIGTVDIDLDLGNDLNIIGFDFNPTVDRIRVEGGTTSKNYRLNPNTSGIAATDLPLNPGTPNVGTVAYTNSFIGATSTALYALDHTAGTISLQNPPNNGTLTNPQSLQGVNGSGVGGAINPINDLDVYYNTGTSANMPYLAASPTSTGTTSLYTLNALGSNPQTATLVGTIGLGTAVRDISVTLDAAATAPTTLAALTGQLVYGVAGGNLISFDSGNPGVIRSSVNITGLPSAAGVAQVLVGADFRPMTGELFALGYDATNQMGQLYTLNTTTGALTAVGSLSSYLLGATASNIGFDFNPTVDRIRVVSATNQVNLRVDPTNGVVATDTPLNNVAGTPAISAVAYTNNDNNGSSGTTLYGYDQSRNVLLRSTNANGGVYVDQGPTGIAVTGAGVDFDVYTNNTTGANTAFAAAATSGTADNLYTVNLTSGAFTSQGRIGNGVNLTGLAVMLTPAAAANSLTWTGLMSADYGTAGNWNPQAVPTATSNILIPGGTPNQPTVSNAQAALNVTVNAGATLTTATGGTLSVSGSVANAGTIAGQATGTVVLAGTAAQTVGGSGTTRFRNLTVNNGTGVSLTGPVGVGGVLNLTAGALTTTGQTLTILSDATGTGLVAQQGGSMVGSLTVQRFINGSINPGPGYRHFSAPVAGDNLSTLNSSGFTPTFNPSYNVATSAGTVRPFPTVFGYDQDRIATSPAADLNDFDKGFVAPAGSDIMESGVGYTVNISANQTPDFTGSLVTSTVTASNLARGASPDAGWHFLGNPFAAPYNWNALVASGGLTNVDNALYVFKSTSQYAGTYSAYVNGVGTNGGVSTLPVAQAYFVRTSAPGQTGTVTMSPANQLTTDNGTLFQRGTADSRTQLSLGLHSGTAAIQTAIYFEAGATAAADARFDAYALPTINGLTLATAVGADAMAINGLPALTGNDVLVPLHIAAASAGTLTVDALTNLPVGYHAYLRDALTGTYTYLAANASIRLNLTANAAAAGRYAVLFSTQARALATALAELAQLASVYPNPAHSAATLLLPVALRGNQATAVQVIDNLGRVVLTRTMAAGTAETLELPLGGLTVGVYTVQARTAAGLVAKRLVVQ